MCLFFRGCFLPLGGRLREYLVRRMRRTVQGFLIAPFVSLPDVRTSSGTEQVRRTVLRTSSLFRNCPGRLGDECESHLTACQRSRRRDVESNRCGAAAEVGPT